MKVDKDLRVAEIAKMRFEYSSLPYLEMSSSSAGNYQRGFS